jgi:hypothetical protein
VKTFILFAVWMSIGVLAELYALVAFNAMRSRKLLDMHGPFFVFDSIEHFVIRVCLWAAWPVLVLGVMSGCTVLLVVKIGDFVREVRKWRKTK